MPRTPRLVKSLAAAVFALALAACGPSSSDADGGDTTVGIGPEGGTVTGPNGAQVVIPAGALSAKVAISVASPGEGAPTFPPENVEPLSDVYAFTPHGQAFAVPATIRIPWDPQRAVTPGAIRKLYRAEPGGAFEPVPGVVVDGDFVEAQVDGFSYFAVGAALVELYQIDGQYPPADIALTPDGLVVMVGFGAQNVGWVVKLSEDGKVLWRSEYQATGSSRPFGFPRVAVGPTGNIYVAAETTVDAQGTPMGGLSDVTVVSFSPGGAARPGWPTRIHRGNENWPAGVVVDVQDNVYVYGTKGVADPNAYTAYRPWLVSYTEGGEVRSGPTEINLSGGSATRRVLASDIALKAAGGLVLTGFVIERDYGPSTGVAITVLDLNGQAAAGFPKKVSGDLGIVGAPLALGPNNTMYVLGSSLAGYNSEGEPLSGFPIESYLPDDARLDMFFHTRVTTNVNGLYFAGTCPSAIGLRPCVMSYTFDGAPRAGTLRLLGGEYEAINSVVDATGRQWVVLRTEVGVSSWLARFVAR